MKLGSISPTIIDEFLQALDPSNLRLNLVTPVSMYDISKIDGLAYYFQSFSVPGCVS